METIIKEFICDITISGNTTSYIHKAVFNPLYENQTYRLKISATKFEDEKRKIDTETTIYYDTLDELLKEYEFYYNLCKNNMFTKYIKITK